MAIRPRTECHQSGCITLTDDGAPYCPAHILDNDEIQRAREYDRRRQDDPLRALYHNSTWTRTRKFVLLRDPLCKICNTNPSTVVDHIIPARIWVEAGCHFYDTENLQGLCKRDHDHKTATEDGGGYNAGIRR